MWNRWRATSPFEKPWLLRFFDILRFHPVSTEELSRLRDDFPRGRWAPRIEPSTFRLGENRRFLSSHAGEIASFRGTQRAAFAEERARWETAGIQVVGASDAPLAVESDVPSGHEAVRAEMPGSLWKYVVAPGDRVAAGDVVAILESMKMESPVTSPCDGIVSSLEAKPGQAVATGTLLAVLKP
jgi:urea carboxylase